MIKDLKNIKKEEVDLFGGKATNLGFLMQNGFNVPDGFCISTQIKKLDKGTKKEIIKRYKKLKSLISVRSSATSEDSKDTSFAGQFDTFLNIKSEIELLKSIEKCWKSVKSERVVAYLKNKNLNNIKMAVIIQKMINADFAGVIFTLDPISEKNVLIEFVKGLGDKLVSGRITPTSYLVDRNSFDITNKSDNTRMKESLIKNLTKTALQIEELYNFPQDIEFAIQGNTIYILQSRPITTLHKIKELN